MGEKKYIEMVQTWRERTHNEEITDLSYKTKPELIDLKRRPPLKLGRRVQEFITEIKGENERYSVLMKCVGKENERIN